MCCVSHLSRVETRMDLECKGQVLSPSNFQMSPWSCSHNDGSKSTKCAASAISNSVAQLQSLEKE